MRDIPVNIYPVHIELPLPFLSFSLSTLLRFALSCLLSLSLSPSSAFPRVRPIPRDVRARECNDYLQSVVGRDRRVSTVHCLDDETRRKDAKERKSPRDTTHVSTSDVSIDSLLWITKLTWNLRHKLTVQNYVSFIVSSRLVLIHRSHSRIFEQEERSGNETLFATSGTSPSRQDRAFSLLYVRASTPNLLYKIAGIHLFLDSENSPRERHRGPEQRLFVLRDTRVFDVRSRYWPRVVASQCLHLVLHPVADVAVDQIAAVTPR